MSLLKLSPLILALAVTPLAVQAANPFLPGYEYIPDGEPRVFGDRVYLYGSHDNAGSTSFCDFILRVWSAPLSDLNTWTDHGISFSTRTVDGHQDDVDWSDNQLYAPDVVEKGGKYYLFAQIVGSPCAVAVSDTPAGPFKLVSPIKMPEGAPMDFGGWSQYFDPGVLVDDDGKVYLYWGYGRAFMAQLNPENMTEILPGTYQEDVIPKGPPFNFFEACSPRKINGKYYLVYADGGTLAYATSDKPTGPFAYGGAIVRNNGRDCPGGNIHGGLAQLNGQWYIFYHRMTNNAVFSRRACAERVTIEADGSIKEVEQTSLGFQESLDPSETTPADIACVLVGSSYVTELDKDTRPLIRNKNGSVIGYKYFDFGAADGGNPMTLSLRVRGGEQPCRIDVLTGSWDGDAAVKIGELEIQTDSSAEWRNVTTEVKPVSGKHAIFFKFSSESHDKTLCDLLEFRFQSKQN